jgi:plasmid rolling circle replication initiator protein Rep
MKTELNQIRELVKSKIFSAVFIKKDGTLREIVCRLGVKKHLKGGELKYSPDDYNYLTVFDMQKEQYRMINVNTLKSIKVDGVTYDV